MPNENHAEQSMRIRRAGRDAVAAMREFHAAWMRAGQSAKEEEGRRLFADVMRAIREGYSFDQIISAFAKMGT